MSGITFEIDTTVDAAYIYLSDARISRTVEISDGVSIDLDEYDIAVGVELMDSSQVIPFDDLLTKFHVRSEVIELLRQIRPSVSRFVAFSTGNDGTSTATSSLPAFA